MQQNTTKSHFGARKKESNQVIKKWDAGNWTQIPNKLNVINIPWMLLSSLNVIVILECYQYTKHNECYGYTKHTESDQHLECYQYLLMLSVYQTYWIWSTPWMLSISFNVISIPNKLNVININIANILNINILECYSHPCCLKTKPFGHSIILLSSNFPLFY